MVSIINIEFQKILLRRRNKFIINKNTKICDIFQKAIESRIFDSEILKGNCTIEKCEALSVKVKLDDKIFDFENGELQNKTETKSLPNSISLLSDIIKDETKLIKEKMAYALSLNENIGELGYCMDEKMFNVVATFSKNEIENLSNEIIPILKEMVGANIKYCPLYPKFPTQVINMKYTHLYLLALLHYWSNGKFFPYPKEKQNRPVVNTEITYKNITIGTEEDLHNLMTNLMGSAEAISSQDIEDLKTYIKEYENFIDAVPEVIPNKENLAIITKFILNLCKDPPIEKISRRFDTVTDVLRLAAVMSDQSPTLYNVRFKSFSNKERRFIMELLNNCQNRVEDFYKYKNMWERVCERIHPMKFKNVYPDLVNDLLGTYKYIRERKNIIKKKKELNKISTLLNTSLITLNSDNVKRIKNCIAQLEKKKFIKKEFEDQVNKLIADKEYVILKNTLKSFIQEDNNNDNIKINNIDKKIKEYKNKNLRFSSKIEKLLTEKNYDAAINMLSQRPGIFARRLDELLEKVNDKEIILNYFKDIASKVSVKVLLSLRGYFQKRYKILKFRVFLINGKKSKGSKRRKHTNGTKMYIKRTVKDALDKELCRKICHICEQALMVHFEDKPKMNNVYISKALKKCVIPLDVRTASSALETYAKGSRFSMTYKQLSPEEQKMRLNDLETDLSTLEEKLKKNQDRLIELNKPIKFLNNMEKIPEDKKVKEIRKINNENQDFNEKIMQLKVSIDECRKEVNRKRGNKVRLFIWWTNNRIETVDIDLSVMIYDEDFIFQGYVSYNSLKDDQFKIYHSGDIVNGGDVNGDGVAEFIDFDPEQIIKQGARYIVVGVISFRGIKFNELDNCKFGWMERELLLSNELFEPKTVRQSIDIKSDNTSTIPVVFDCQKRQVIWVDTILTKEDYNVNIENTSEQLDGILYYYINPLKDNMYNLLNLHVRARNGNLVKSENELTEGDIAFVPYLPYKCIEGVKYIRPTDLDIILSEYMTSNK